jgi:ribose-phosphate pyrophosphokinase
VFVVQSLSYPVSEHIMEMLILIDALRSASARRITAVLPYFSYARSDKKDHPRISITARLLADILETAGANRALTMTLHSPQVHGFFHVPTDHLTAVPIVCDYLKQNLDLSNVVALAADAGSAKRAGEYASKLNVPMAFVDKRRIGDSEVEARYVVGDVEGKDIIVFDDEIATGGSLLATITAIEKVGVGAIYAGATHGVFCGPAPERIAQSSLKEVVVTNTVHIPSDRKARQVTILSVAPLFGEAIKRIHTGESVGALFV